MNLIKQLKEHVSNKVYKRGINYYKSNKIQEYDYYLLEDNSFKIVAWVSGSYLYQVLINLELTDGHLHIDGSCDCPYNWEEFCKHKVAVLYRFFKEDYPSLGSFKELGLNKLVELSQAVKPVEDINLEYEIKGLLTDSMVNFKLTLKSDKLTSNRLEGIISSIRSPYYLDLDELEGGLPLKDKAIINYLSKIETKKSQTDGALLFAKDKANFNFLLNLIEENTVFFSESGGEIEVGEILYPGLIMLGDEDEVRIEVKNNGTKIYKGDGISWRASQSRLHPLKMENLTGVPEKIIIPEDRKGEFLFEVLPSLKDNLDLELDDNLKGYNLINQAPQIKLEFDYQKGVILCRLIVEINGQTYKNSEIIGFDTDNKDYRRSEDDDKLWFSWNLAEVERLLNFFEEYGFHVKPNAFNIKDENGIQEFITDGFMHLPEEWEVTTTDAFDEVEIKPVELEPIIETIEDGDDINWFEFKITYNIGGKTYSREELEKLIRYNKQGEGYLHLDNQYFILKENDKEERVKNLLEVAQGTDDGSYKSSYYHLLYYRNLVEEVGIQFKGNRVYNQLNQDITAQNLVKEVEIPKEIEGVLRDYQKDGYYWMRFLAKYRFGGILADDMGLGKTLQTLTFLKSIKEEKPALIICPRTLIYNWGAEVRKFFSKTDYLVYYGTPAEREEMRKGLNDYEMIITSYSIISRDYEELEDISFSTCILDEAHHIKNHRTKRAQGVKRIRAQKRIALTGTPIENSLEELWSIFDFLMPGYLNNYSRFRKDYLNPIVKEKDQQKLSQLKKRISPFILRRKKEDVLKDLPEKLINIHQVEMTKLQEDSYKVVLEGVKDDLTETIEERGFNRSRINVLAALTKLRQICDHPQLALDQVDKELTSGKLDALVEIVEDAIAAGHKLIVFSQFVQMLKLIKKEFEKKGIVFEYLDGSTRDRMKRVDRFNQSEEIKVFLISLKAGGIGLNLTSADIVVHVDPWWNPMVERQATDRAHRIGQKNKVTVYKLITAGTVEEKMLKLQERKKSIFNNVIEDNTNPMDDISWEDIQELLQYE